MVDTIAAGYLAALGLTGLVAFRDAPKRLWAALREERTSRDRLYHTANLASVLVIAAWLAALALGLDRAVLPEASWRVTARLLPMYASWLGFAYGLRARWMLGGAFAPTAATPPGGDVVEEGPYARLRHPFYLALLGAMAAGVLALDSLATLIALLALAPVVHVIAAREEAHLAEELGGAYEAYRERVPRWVPRLGRGP